MQAFWNDVRHGARTLAKSPGITTLAILTLALGIGADTAIFSIVYGALLRPFPYAEPERILWIDHTVPRQNLDSLPVSYPNFTDWRDENRAFAQMVAWRYNNFNLSGDQDTERVEGIRVSANLFSLLGVTPMRGRGFLPDEDRPGGVRVVVISQGLWQRRFGGRPEAVGSTLTLDGEAHTVIGIMPPDFNFPEIAELWVPLALDPARAPRENRQLRVISRLSPGVTLRQAQAEMTNLGARLEAQYPGANAGLGVRVIPLRDFYLQNTRTAILLSFGAVGLLLIVACVNVANFLLARAAVRGKEITIRAALGASRFRLARQMLTESVLLGLAAGGLGCLLAYWGLDLIVSQVPIRFPFWMKFRIDGFALGFSLLTSITTGLVFGFVPVLSSWKTDLQTVLKENGRGTSGSRGQKRLRHLLVVSETALAVVLLAGAGVMVRSFLELQRFDTGLRTSGLLCLEVELPASRYSPSQQVAFTDELVERTSRLPGVERAGLSWQLPLRRSVATTVFTVEGHPAATPAEVPMAAYRSVSPGFFPTLGIRLEQGRYLHDADGRETTPVAVISRTMAERFWPGEDPIGRRIKLARPAQESPWLTIAGVVMDVRNNWFGADLRPTIYVSSRQAPNAHMNLIIGVHAGDPLRIAAAVRHQVASLDRDLPIFNITTMERVMLESFWRNRLFAIIFSVFAVVALVLCAGGLYAVISFSAVQRFQEIGLRLALGASRRDILRLIIGEGMGVALAGTAIGLLAAFGSTRLLSGLLFGVQAADPLTFAGLALLVPAVALAACYVPAARAMRTDPLAALHHT
ncbi:MAG: ABC transporter permease [Acidobacteria bacterium]|nr:ABC transporter permease [Acidobacteriota bacterium]